MSKHLLYPVLAGALLLAQGPVNDVITVTFPTDVQVGSRVLKAGDYTIRQLSTSSNPRILEFSTEQGTSIQATATAIAALDNNNRKDSSVELESQGGMQHVHRIWLKGKSYGYEFPMGASRMTSSSTATSSGEQMRLTATYTPASQVAENATQRAVPDRAAEPVAQANQTPERAAEPVAQATPAPAEAAATTPQVADNTAQRQTPERAAEPAQATSSAAKPDAQADAQSVANPAPAPESAAAPQRVSATSDGNLPETASNLPTLLVSGLGLLLTAWVLKARY